MPTGASVLKHNGPPSGARREEVTALVLLVALFAITAAWWALALWPTPNGPQWLARTRYVCFGVTETGLPDAGGWIGLIAGPLGMLAILVVGWGSGVRSLLAHAAASRTVAAALATLALGVVFMLIGAGWRVSQARSAAFFADVETPLPASTYPRIDRPAPELRLLAHDGVERSLADLRGRPVLVTFAYAHCQTVCPLIVNHALAAQAALRTELNAPAVVIVTLDPWRDTPSRLAAMAQGWRLPVDDAWVFGGDVAPVEAALDAWEIPRRRDPLTGEITHPSLVYIVDAAGQIAYAATGGAEAIAALVRRL
jgi:cytochrome oxidase Cu insertion factor (SCO1/SenC/PrrC family)